jgi:hypothetical protein
MTLTDAQIDRYSRQIIVPRIGGRGQERLLTARMLLVGDARDIEAPLAYMAGAGVGSIMVKAPETIETIAAMRELNPDVKVTDELKAPVDLALIIVGSEAARKVADKILSDVVVRALVLARLDAPGTITIIPNTQGPQSADAQFGTRSEAADFIAMLATAEAFKLIAGYAENPARATIEFDGYATTVRVHP